ncbi:MAG: PD-(D/E)XK nuclease family protein, partial [Bacteroidales bacterium]|nr:PD-(D/E)XK nuclease family protein [Bacteroidales bacterium]
PTFVFVGLNALNECEKLVMRRMRDARVAQFCWDYSGRMITDPLNKSSFFMADNVKEFPQAFDFDDVENRDPKVTVVSVPSGVGQVKIVPDLIRGKDDCAVVLPDEQLLMPLLNTIPPEIGEINVTMGRSMSSSVFHSLMCSVASLQLYMKQRGGEWAFYHRAVREIFSNGIFARALDSEGKETVAAIHKAARIYVSQSDFKGGLQERVFRPVVMDPKATDPEQIRRFAEYLMDVVVAVVDGLKGTDGEVDEMVLGFAKTWYCEMSRLASKRLSILPATWIRLMKRVMDPISVPFRGEPLRGLQIMGPLETRALDFTNLVILSANESVFPGRNISSSFIPPELRSAFKLPTYEFQDAVWAYYFYRMISRAETVTLVYDSRTEGLHTGEESRYIKQLEMHFNVPVHRMVAGVAIGRQEEQGDIVKTPEDLAKLRDVTFSATTVRNYLSCPAKFYYSKIRELAPESEISETLDQRTVGTVFHAAMQALYSGGDSMTPDGKPREQKTYHGPGEPTWIITRNYLKAWRGRSDAIREKVGRLVMDELGVPEISGRDLVTIDVIVSYIMKAIDRDLEYLKANGVDHFTVCGLELPVALDREDIRFEGYKFYGLIDRLDSLAPGTIRVCDYKTGRVLDEDLDINPENAQERADAVFAPESKNRPEIALQVFIYDMLLKRNGCRDSISNTIYQTAGLFGAPVKVIPYCETFYNAMEEGLRGLMSEIADSAVPFRRTEDRRTCEYCDFKMICGR